MTLDNDQIAKNVNHVVDVILKGLVRIPGSEDEELIRAGSDLVINLLQNINTIAYCMQEIEQRGRPNQ